MASVTINGRFLCHKVTGVQRYALEITKALGDSVNVVRPQRDMAGMGGHLWEQTVLPLRAGSTLLWSPSGTGPLACSRQIVTVHDLSFLDHPEWFSKKYAAWYRFIVPRLLRRVQHVIAVSEFTRERVLIVTGIPEEKVTVVPNGVDGRFQPASAEEVARIRAKYSAGKEYVLAVGSLEPRKNLGRLFQAWQRVRAEGRQIELLVAGARAEIFTGSGFGEQVPAGIRLLGYVDEADLPGLYGAATTFVYPSLYEGFGLPPLEAMACGTPVVCSDRTSLPEVVGDTGLLVDPFDGDSIAHALGRMLDDSELRTTLGRRGLERSQSFSWERAARATQEVFDRVIEREQLRPSPEDQLCESR